MTGDEEQVGGFDLIFKNKPIKIVFGKNNYSMLGCLNNRQQQLKKVAKAVALKYTHPEKRDVSQPQPQQQPVQKKAWGANNSSKTSEIPKRITNSVEPTRLPKVLQAQTHVKFPEIAGKVEPTVKKIMSNLADNSRYKVTR